ncbi:hypothetical protein HDV63DRAFT_362175 [Trichoderma sp. SZMC 28014]
MYKAVALTSIAALAGQTMALNAHRHQHQMDKKALVVDWTTIIETVTVTVDPNASTPAAAAPTSSAGGFAAQDVNPTGPAVGNAAAASSSVAAASSPVVVASSSAAPAAQSTTLVTSVRPTVPVVVSSSVAPVVPSSAPVSSAPAPPTTSEQPTPTPTPSSSSVPAPVSSSTSQAAPSATPSKAPSSPPVSAGHFGRGMAYNDGVLANVYGALSGKMGWAYNWGFYPSGIDSQFSYIPTLWSPAPEHSTGFAAQVETLLASGTKAIFSFNEPDIASQANMSPADAASAHQQWLNQYSGKALIGAPAVSNSQSPGQGADWLQQWVAACAGSCNFDFVNMHWYSPASAIDTFFSQIEAVSQAGGGKPVFITEFQPSGTVDEITAFLQEALPKLDSNPNVLGYSYFMVANSGSADGLNLMASATDASTIGLTYAST